MSAQCTRARAGGPRRAPVEAPDTREAGAATLWVAAGAGLVAAVSLVVLLLAAVSAAGARAQAAADLGALAGATAARQGADACAAVRVVVAADGASLGACAQRGAEVAVTVWAPLPPVLARFGAHAVASSARAGPAAGGVALRSAAGAGAPEMSRTGVTGGGLSRNVSGAAVVALGTGRTGSGGN